MFDRVAERYDLLNGLLSLGLDRMWRRATARAANVPAGGRAMDLGCGTGALGRMLPRRAVVVGVDVSHRMLMAARRTPLHLVEASALALPFPDASFDAVVSGFVLRNLDDLRTAFAELARIVRPGGRAALLDITEPRNPALRAVFDAYFRTVAPTLGALAGQGEAYRYLANSLAQLPTPVRVVAMLREAGFRRASPRALTGGVVTLFTAIR